MENLFFAEVQEDIAITVTKIVRDRKVTAVELNVVVFSDDNRRTEVLYNKSFVGSATRNLNDDKYDYYAGMTLALSRALKKAEKDLDVMGWQRVQYKEKIAKAKRAEKEEARVPKKRRTKTSGTQVKTVVKKIEKNM